MKNYLEHDTIGQTRVLMEGYTLQWVDNAQVN